MTASRCPSKLDHRASGTVLWCAKDRDHDRLHMSGDQVWADGDEYVIQGGDACCAGEWGYAGPVDMHSEDCPDYLAWAEAHVARQREQRQPPAGPLPKPALAVWLAAEYIKARTAAREAAAHNASIRRREGSKAVPCFHSSAVARMCAFGEVLQLLDLPVPAEGDPR